MLCESMIPIFSVLLGVVGGVRAFSIAQGAASALHASTRACNARSCVTTSGAALPVSLIRCVQASSQRLSLSAVKPLRLSPSSTKTSWLKKISIASVRAASLVAGAAAVILFSFK